MKKIASFFFVFLLFGCSNDTINKERITILKNETDVAYSESQNLLAPSVCLEIQQEEKSDEPFLVNFEVTEGLKSNLKRTPLFLLIVGTFLMGVRETFQAYRQMVSHSALETLYH